MEESIEDYHNLALALLHCEKVINIYLLIGMLQKTIHFFKMTMKMKLEVSTIVNYFALVSLNF